jgi:hypothetical protein
LVKKWGSNLCADETPTEASTLVRTRRIAGEKARIPWQLNNKINGLCIPEEWVKYQWKMKFNNKF